MSFRIDVYNFVQWRGSPPTIPQDQVLTHHRAGATGLSQQIIGKWGKAFECDVTAHYSSFLLAMEGYRQMAQLPGAGGVQILFGGVDYSQFYGTEYHVESVDIVDLQTNVVLAGPGYYYAGGTALTVRFKMTSQGAF